VLNLKWLEFETIHFYYHIFTDAQFYLNLCTFTQVWIKVGIDPRH